MSEKKSQEIARLAAIAHDKRRVVQTLGLMNTHGASPEDARKWSMQYATALAEMNNAQGALDAVLHGGRPAD